MEGTKARIYEFGSFRLYPDQKLLFKGDQRLDVDRKALAILEILVQNRGQLVTKERLLKEVWADVSVEEGNLNVHVSKIRRLLGDERRQPEYIETVHGEGYRFVANVAERQEQLYPAERLGRARVLAFSAFALLAMIVAAMWVWKAEKRRHQTKDQSTVSTESVDAQSKYELAVKYESEGDDEEALAALDEATQIDKNFADGYLRAALLSDQMGEEEQALRYLNQAKNCSGTPTEHQRLQMEALEAELTEGYQEGIKKYRLLIDAYPDDVASQYYFADLAMENRKEFAEARDALEQCLRRDPANRYCEFDRMTLYVLNNDFDGAIKLYGSLTPSVHYPWFDEPFGLALYGKGDVDKARTVLGNFSKGTRTHGLTTFTTGREWLADIDFFQGKTAQATNEIEVLLPSDSEYGVSTHYLYLARVSALLSNHANARTMALKAVTQHDDRDTRVEAAGILACLGNVRDTDRLLHLANGQAINDLLPATENFIDGCKALNSRDYDGAIRQLQASYDIDDDLYTEFYLAKAFIAARQWDNAITILKDLEASKGRIIADQVYPPVIWPLAQYYLAVVYDESGEKSKAVSYCSQFLEIWKNGDSTLPAVADAKRRLARLRAENKTTLRE
jgi:DNA-binding winged helix-turn-helix (wHTH) protein/thioredoxin-like negative regulator of GroEL